MVEDRANFEELDKEWILLMKEAMHLGLKKEDVKNFLLEGQVSLEAVKQE